MPRNSIKCPATFVYGNNQQEQKTYLPMRFRLHTSLMNFVLSDIPHGTSFGKMASFSMNSLAYFQIKTKEQFWRKFVKSGERSCTNPNSGGTFVPLYIVGPYDLGLPRPHIAIRPQLQLHQVGRISDGVLRLRRGSK